MSARCQGTKRGIPPFQGVVCKTNNFYNYSISSTANVLSQPITTGSWIIDQREHKWTDIAKFSGQFFEDKIRTFFRDRYSYEMKIPF